MKPRELFTIAVGVLALILSMPVRGFSADDCPVVDGHVVSDATSDATNNVPGQPSSLSMPKVGVSGDGADPFGDNLGVYAFNASQAPNNEVTFIPDASGGGTKQIRDGKGNLIIEQSMDADGHVTSQTDYYPGSGAIKKTSGESGGMQIDRYYDPPKEGQQKGAERVTEAHDRFGNQKVTRRDSDGKMTEMEKTDNQGNRTVTRFGGSNNKPMESTSFHSNGNVSGVTGYNQDGSGSGTLYGEDGQTVKGTVQIDTKGNTTTTYYDNQGNMTERRTVDQEGKVIHYETPGQAPVPTANLQPPAVPVSLPKP